MPLNEAGGPKRSNLTQQQKSQAMAAIFGIEETLMSNEQQLSSQEIERMRSILAQHDAAKPVNEFDLNNPPKQAYRHQEFPKMVYHHESRKQKIVKDEMQLEQHLQNGWSRDPFVAEEEAPVLSTREQQEVARLDKEARKPKAK